MYGYLKSNVGENCGQVHARWETNEETTNIWKSARKWRTLFCYEQSNSMCLKTQVNLNYKKGFTLFGNKLEKRPQKSSWCRWKEQTLLAENKFTFGLNVFKRRRKQSKRHYTLHSPDLAPADFFLFPRFKRILKGSHFADMPDIRRRVACVVHSFPKKTIAKSIQQFYQRWQMCIVANGGYFEGE